MTWCDISSLSES